jgi:putative transposase
VTNGARLFKACEVLGINERTYFRWIKLNSETGSFEDLRPLAERTEPVNKLSETEREQVIKTVNQP